MVVKRANADKISIHAAQEGCDPGLCALLRSALNISIHAAQEGCDPDAMSDLQRIVISIHAAQEGCDCRLQRNNPLCRYFNPRSPRGLRRNAKRTVFCSNLRFQSTQPKRAATIFINSKSRCKNISIHAAQEGCDQNCNISGPKVEISIHAAQEGCDPQAR